MCNHQIGLGATNWIEYADGHVDLISNLNLIEMRESLQDNQIFEFIAAWFDYCPKCGKDMRNAHIRL